MPYTRRTLAVLLGTAVLSLSAIVPALRSQDEPPEPRKVTYELKDGKHVRGVVVDAEGDRIRMKVSLSGGSSTRWFDLADFELKSQVRVQRDQVAEGDLLGQLGVAEFANSHGLIEMSRTELRRCAHMLKLAPEPRPEGFESRALKLTLQLLEGLATRGDISEARHAVTSLLVRYEDSLSEDEKNQLIQAVEGGVQRHKSKLSAARNAKETAQDAAKREKHLKGVRSDLEKGEKRRRKGLLGSRKYTSASRDLHAAVKLFESALKDTEKLSKKFSDDAFLVAELKVLGDEARTQVQDCLLSSASLELARGSFNRSMEDVNRIIADDPKHKQALAMRQRIEVAQSDWGWGWGNGRRR